MMFSKIIVCTSFLIYYTKWSIVIYYALAIPNVVIVDENIAYECG